jgi:nitrogen regulatory protein PII
MDEQRFNMSMRKFLKVAGVTSQHEIERIVADEHLAGKGELKVKMVLTAEGTSLEHVVEGIIDSEQGGWPVRQMVRLSHCRDT